MGVRILEVLRWGTAKNRWGTTALKAGLCPLPGFFTSASQASLSVRRRMPEGSDFLAPVCEGTWAFRGVLPFNTQLWSVIYNLNLKRLSPVR